MSKLKKIKLRYIFLKNSRKIIITIKNNFKNCDKKIYKFKKITKE